MRSQSPLFNLVGIFDGTFFFLTIIIASFGIAGLMSKSFVMGEYSAFIGFITITQKTEYTFFVNLMYVILVLVFMMLSFQIFNMTQGETNGGSV